MGTKLFSDFNWLIADTIRDVGSANNNDTISVAIPILLGKRIIDMRSEYNRGFYDPENTEKVSCLEMEDGDLTSAIYNYQNDGSPLAIESDKVELARITWEDIADYPDEVCEEIDWEFRDGYGGTCKLSCRNRVELFFDVLNASCNKDVLRVFDRFEFERRILIKPIFKTSDVCKLFAELIKYDFSLSAVSYDVFSEAYMDLLVRFAPQKNSKEGEFFTPFELGALLPQLIKPEFKAGRTVRIADPSAGSSTLLVEAGRYMMSHLSNDKKNMVETGYVGDRFKLLAQDKDPTSYAVGLANLIINGFVVNSEYYHGNTISEYVDNIGMHEGQVDYIFANPPFSTGDYGVDYAKANEFRELERWKYGIPNKGLTENAFIQTIMALLSSTGKAAVILPYGVLFRSDKQTMQLRRKLIDDDHIEAVIGFPSNLFATTGISVCALVLNKNKPAERRGSVLFINAEKEFTVGKKQNIFSQQYSSHLLDVFHGYCNEKRYSKVVPMDEIRENDYNLNIRRYVDTSPPPEQFDVKAILNGGVPASEVEDEYIQETLDGMDVSCVFVRRDDAYYDFKLEIETKEQIREHLGEVEQPVISQFERWWDKYRVSLHELDTQVKQSEEVMWGYLKELGYE